MKLNDEIATRRLITMLLKNGQEVVIRKAKKEDAQAIIDFFNMVGGESDNLLFGANEFGKTLEQEEQLIEKVSDSNTAGLFIAFIGSEIASVANLSNPYRKRIAHTCDIGMAVKKKFWDIGVGSAMTRALIEFAKASKQIEIIGLGVRIDNIAAQGLYRKMGFVEIGRYPKFFKIEDEYFDSILMNLYL